MASTKATTPTRRAARRAGVALLGAALAGLAAFNLFLTMTPVAARNEALDAEVLQAAGLPPLPQQAAFAVLRADEERCLARKPSEPYAWARLAYLRLAVAHDATGAFAALRMSDGVSPYEAPELPERALMWWRLRAVESAAARAYQDELWRKAYAMRREAMWAMAAQTGVADIVGAALGRTDHGLYEEWTSRVAGTTASGPASNISH